MDKSSYFKLLGEKLTAIVQKFKSFITTNIKKILIVGMILSLVLNFILLLFGLSINYVNTNTNTQYQTSKNDVWSINQNQNINLNMVFDRAQFEGGKRLIYITTNISTNALVGVIGSMTYFQYLNLKIAITGDRAFLFYPELKDSNYIIKSIASSSNVYTNYSTSTNKFTTSLSKFL